MLKLEVQQNTPFRSFLRAPWQCVISYFSVSKISWKYLQWRRRWTPFPSTPTRGWHPAATPSTMVSIIFVIFVIIITERVKSSTMVSIILTIFKIIFFVIVMVICRTIIVAIKNSDLTSKFCRRYARQPGCDWDWSDPPSAHVLLPLPPNQTHPPPAQGAQSTPGTQRTIILTQLLIRPPRSPFQFNFSTPTQATGVTTARGHDLSDHQFAKGGFHLNHF